MPVRLEVIGVVNAILRTRLRYQRTTLRGLEPDEPLFTTLQQLKGAVTITDGVLTQHQSDIKVEQATKPKRSSATPSQYLLLYFYTRMTEDPLRISILGRKALKKDLNLPTRMID